MIVNDKTNFLDESLLTHRRIGFLKFLQIICNECKFDKTQISKIIQSRGFLDKVLGTLLNFNYHMFDQMCLYYVLKVLLFH